MVVDLLRGDVRLRDGAGARDWSLLWWLPLQRFGYRQLMYYVVVRSISTAIARSVRRLGQAGAARHGQKAGPAVRNSA